MQKPSTPRLREDETSSSVVSSCRDGGPIRTTLFLPNDNSDESPFVFSNMVVGLFVEAVVVMVSSDGCCLEASRVVSVNESRDTNADLRLDSGKEGGTVVVFVVCGTSARADEQSMATAATTVAWFRACLLLPGVLMEDPDESPLSVNVLAVLLSTRASRGALHDCVLVLVIVVGENKV